jgi:signal transduction histidine kinase
MVASGPRSRRFPLQLSRIGLPLLVLAAGLLCTGLAVFQLRSLIDDAERLRFENLASSEADLITDRIDTYVALLRGVAGLFSADSDVTGPEFRAYFDRLRINELYPGVNGIGYAKVVRPEEREALIARLRAEGETGFRIWPEGERDFVTSILYLEPREIRNQAAIGYDMYSEPIRRAAMDASRDSGVRAATASVVLVQEQGKTQQPGFLIYVPVYRTPFGVVPKTVEERRDMIRGWVYSPFRANELFTRAFGLREKSKEVEYVIHDGAEETEDNILYQAGNASNDGRYSTRRRIEVATRTWTIAMHSTARFAEDANRAVVPFVLGGGLLATFMLFGASLGQARAYADAEHAREQLHEINQSLESRVEERTAQLESARGALENLNRNLETIVDTRTADLVAANEEIQRFAYIVSHDLRSPLVNVMGFTSELQVAREAITGFYADVVKKHPDMANPAIKEAIESELPEAIDFIRSSTSKMDRLINAILRLSREGGRVLTPEPLQLKQLLETAAQSLNHQLTDAGAELVIEDVPDIVGDRLATEQIFANLLENAVKYLAPGRPGRIRVRGWQEGSTVFVDVEDNGRGIDPRDHSRVFDLFRRAGAQDRPGEGIGLAHVRALVRRLGGTITLSSVAGEGSTFRVSLPKILTKANEGKEA